jgi:5-methylcytosine-specific restriction endonuclease McrA
MAEFTLFDGKVCSCCGMWVLLEGYRERLDRKGNVVRFGQCEMCFRCKKHDKYWQSHSPAIYSKHRKKKRCPQCGETKPKDEFYKSKSRPDGHDTYCKSCVRDRHRPADGYISEKIRATETDKCCLKCGLRKPLSDFVVCFGNFANTCVECKKAYIKQWRADRVDHVRAKNKAWREVNKDRIREIDKLWALANKDKCKAGHRRWQLRHPSKVCRISHVRRARLRGCEGDYTVQEWLELCVQYDNHCLCCMRNDLPLTIDHIVPIARGGSNSIDNMQPLCGRCNSRKNAKTIDYRTNWEKRQFTDRFQEHNSGMQ